MKSVPTIIYGGRSIAPAGIEDPSVSNHRDATSKVGRTLHPEGERELLCNWNPINSQSKG